VDGDAARLAEAIGARVKRRRRARGWTLDQLAAAARLSRRMIVSVEAGAVNPSVGTLLRLADALGTGLPRLVAPPEPKPIRVTRAADAAVRWTGPAGGRGVLVAGTASPGAVGLWDWTLGPGETHTRAAQPEGTRELLHVLEGALTVEVDGRPTALGPGDAIAFPGDVEHRYTNPHASPARFALAVIEPGTAPPRPDASDE
jgi:transcriptional regulator with XRE-family HTH domain